VSLDKVIVSEIEKKLGLAPLRGFDKNGNELVDFQVEVDDTEIRIIGRKSVLEQLVIGRGGSSRSAQFVRKWRAAENETGHRYVMLRL
jgi:hypothetical protein